SRDPVTYRNSLWLLPSGPDQIHDPAMRGDPPLIGCALRRTCIIAAIHSSHWRPPRRGCRRGYNLPHILHCGIHVSRPPLPAPPPAPRYLRRVHALWAILARATVSLTACQPEPLPPPASS